MRSFRGLSAIVVILASVAAFGADAPFHSANVNPQPMHKRKRDPRAVLTIEKPQWGEGFKTKSVEAILSLGSELNARTLKVFLNGKNITSAVRQDRCLKNTREVKVKLSSANGLRFGENNLRATVMGFDHHVESRHVRFDHLPDLLGASNLPNNMPSAVGFKVAPGGQWPVATFITGTPAALVDDTDQTLYQIPYPDTQLPTQAEYDGCTNGTMLVLVMKRQTPLSPTTPYSFTCEPDAATLKSYLQSVPADSLVVVESKWQTYTINGLDTTAIGGTNFTQVAANMYPLGYLCIGVPGAPAGSAYESYYVQADLGLLQTNPFANGILAQDPSGNYNFYPSNTVQFEVIPGSAPSFSIATQAGVGAYGPPQNSANGFWLLTLDRTTLQPIDVNVSSGCVLGLPGGTCGQFFNTGSADPDTASAAMASLATAIQAVTTRQLLALVSVGQVFQTSQSVSSTLAYFIGTLGGSRYTLPNLTSPTATFTLVGPGLANSPSGTPPMRSPFTRGLVTSSSVFSQQGQTGIIRGILERDTKGLYLPTVASQEDGFYNGPGATSLSLDYSFHQIAAYPQADWPLTDTTNHIAAYHAVSLAYLTTFGETGTHSQDLRYFYAGDPTKFSSNHGYLNDQTNDNCLATQKLPPNSTFTLQDWCDARAQLYQELLSLYNSDQYLGEDGIEGLLDGSKGQGSIAGDVIGVATTLLSKQLIAPKSSVSGATINAKIAEWMNFASAIVAVASTAVDPAELPFVAGAISATSGGLKAGSTFTVFDNASAPLSYENGFDTTLGNIDAQANDYQANLVKSYGVALDAIYSDWGKLQATGAKTADSDSGWGFLSQVQPDFVSGVLQQGTNRALYMQTLPQFYSLDYYDQQPVSTIDKIGTLSYDAVTTGWSCVAVYPSSILPSGYGDYTSIGVPGNKTDFLVIGGAIQNQNRSDVSESLPSTDLLNTLFGQPDPNDSTTSGYLHLPADLFYATDKTQGGYLAFRSGPSQGNGICYKPGCSGKSDYSDCVGP